MDIVIILFLGAVLKYIFFLPVWLVLILAIVMLRSAKRLRDRTDYYFTSLLQFLLAPKYLKIERRKEYLR